MEPIENKTPTAIHHIISADTFFLFFVQFFSAAFDSLLLLLLLAAFDCCADPSSYGTVTYLPRRAFSLSYRLDAGTQQDEAGSRKKKSNEKI